MKRALLFVCLAACAATQPTKVQSPQDFERETTSVVDRVLEIFQEGGINCNMISGDLRGLNGSQRMAALRAWRNDHPEATETLKTVVAARRADLEKAMGPSSRQCGGTLQGLVQDLTQ